ncbi:hypothetical protein ACWDBY_23780 [Nocardia sp. NPDC001010]
MTALKGLLADASSETEFAALGSVKSQIGHTKGAAGTAGELTSSGWSNVSTGTSTRAARSSSPQVVAAPAAPVGRRSGTILDSMPAERRITAVVRAVTGRLSTASGRSVSRPR